MRRVTVTGYILVIPRGCLFMEIQCFLTFKCFRNFIFDLGDLYIVKTSSTEIEIYIGRLVVNFFFF